jgi:hypothetical protein
MRFPTADRVRARLVENPKAAVKVRLASLEAIREPSLSLLARLLSNPATPSRLLALAAQRYETALATRRKKSVRSADKRSL